MFECCSGSFTQHVPIGTGKFLFHKWQFVERRITWTVRWLEVLVMSVRLHSSPALGSLEAFAVQFDPPLDTLAQRYGFRTYLARLLMPRDRSKTLTALFGAELVLQAKAIDAPTRTGDMEEVERQPPT
jgi:hypothetical protein